MDVEDMNEEELLKRAKELSMQGEPGQSVQQNPPKAEDKAPAGQIFEDEAFIEELLKSQDVSKEDPEIQKLLEEFKKKKKDEGK
jgi:hypothetical protein